MNRNTDYVGPEIPGLYFVGNHSLKNSSEQKAIESYSSKLSIIPREAFSAIIVEYYGIPTVAIYVEQQYSPIIDKWIEAVNKLLETFINMYSEE